ncbi:hypothetical protein GWI33_006428 [Rhynchophorus ferrugineus]|uniref:Uncharacterized protein n=1 Tax=Rhynchophorus ferrugineus TaxID=354439 RepID=A0A834IUK6_RHYFE|nr:hypothetical protein GWI33_006428 [Rhynchophorus ferrugineus]
MDNAEKIPAVAGARNSRLGLGQLFPYEQIPFPSNYWERTLTEKTSESFTFSLADSAAAVPSPRHAERKWVRSLRGAYCSVGGTLYRAPTLIDRSGVI